MDLKELTIYPTNKCNLNCEHCYADIEETQSLDMEDLEWVKSTFNPKKVILLGGEPLMYENLETIFEMFSDSNMQISSNCLLVPEKVDLLKKYDVSVQVSVEGGKKETDNLRGKGVWDKVVSSLEVLKENDVDFYIRCSYHFYNLDMLGEVFKLADRFDVYPMFFPRVDRPPLRDGQQRDFFDYVLDSGGIVGQPNFFRYIGKDGRCGAGNERLNVHYNKKITPCNLDLDYALGEIGYSEEEIKKHIEMYLETFKTTPMECGGCKHADGCKGGCYVAKCYLSCPLKLNLDVGEYIARKGLDSERVQNQVDNATDFVKDVIVC